MFQATASLSVADRLHALEMAIAYDAPESIMGDYTPADNVSVERKRIEENLAMDYIGVVSTDDTHLMLRERLAEYNKNKSPISKLVHQADKTNALIQAL